MGFIDSRKITPVQEIRDWVCLFDLAGFWRYEPERDSWRDRHRFVRFRFQANFGQMWSVTQTYIENIFDVTIGFSAIMWLLQRVP